MSDVNDKIGGILKEALKHSSDQIFAIFSGILVIYSLKTNSKELIFIGFITLFYAIIAHRLTALRKHEELGDYAVGHDTSQIKLFTTIYHLYFLWWTTAIIAILLYYLFPCFLIYLLLLLISTIILFGNFILTIIWFNELFRKMQDDRKKWNKNYKLKVFCTNCNRGFSVRIETGVTIKNWRCPRCKTKSLTIKQKELEIKKYKIHKHLFEEKEFK